MPTLPVHLHVPGRTVPATLSSDHSASSYGEPVLLLAPEDAGPSYQGREHPIPHGPGDVTRWGPAGGLHVSPAGPDVDTAGSRLINAWWTACASYRGRGGYMEPRVPEDAPAAAVDASEQREVVGRAALPDGSVLLVQRHGNGDDEAGVVLTLHLVPEGRDLLTVPLPYMLDVIRALETAVGLPPLYREPETGAPGAPGTDR